MAHARPVLSPSTITATTPLRLDMAAELAFPGGSMTASGLRKEWTRGRLAIERIAGKDYTTLAAIEEMRKLCRLDQKEPVSGSSLAAQKLKSEPPSRPYGSSGTETGKSALAAARMRAEKLKNGLLSISSNDISLTKPAPVIPLKSR